MVALTRIVLGAAAALATQLVALARADEGVTVRIMSFNVRTSFASEDARATCSNWHGVRKTNVIKEINMVSPDFFGTQETADEQRVYMDATLAGTYTSIGKSTGSLNGMASEVDALYYKVADWKVISEGTFWLGPNPDVPSAAWGMKYYRTAVWGRFEHIKSGQTACVFNTHYETPGNDEAQIQASMIILQKLDALCQATDKIKVVMGDFNALPNYPAMLKLFQNDLKESSSEPTFCGDMMSPTCQTKFDYTLHRLKDGACWKKSEVLRTAFDGCYPSDHAALLGTFCFGGSCCSDDSKNATTSGSLSGSNSTAPGGGVMVLNGTFVPGKVSPAGGDAASSTSGTATQVISTKSEASSNATGTVFAIIGVIGATAGVAFFVVRKKKELDAKLNQAKDTAAPVPSYFTRSLDSQTGDDALSPLTLATRMTAPSPGRMSNSPVPTLCATKRSSRDSRSSSVSCKDLSPSKYARKSSAASNFRISSPAMMDDSGSNYSSSASFDSRMQDSRINFSEAYVSASYDSDEDASGSGGALTKSQTDFAML